LLDVNLTCAALAGEECLDSLAGDQQLSVDVGHSDENAAADHPPDGVLGTCSTVAACAAVYTAGSGSQMRRRYSAYSLPVRARR
jgi:hypothetical protein